MVMGLALVLKFQNCAPAPMSTEFVSEPKEDDSMVSVIDQIPQAEKNPEIQFATKSIRLAASQSWFRVQGLCTPEQAGATLRWELRDPDGLTVGAGTTRCLEQQFWIEAGIDELIDCRNHFYLVALLDTRESAPVEVRRNCN